MNRQTRGRPAAPSEIETGSSAASPAADARSAPARSGKIVWGDTAVAAAVAFSICIYCLFLYGDCVRTFFFLDDFWVLRDAARAYDSGWGPLQIFRFGHAGFTLYRPLTTVGYFYVLRAIFGVDSSGYHLVQVFVFALNSILVYALAVHLLESRVASLVTALLYATAPGHAAAVVWLASFTMTGSATAVLAMLWWWTRSGEGIRRSLGCLLLQGVALLSSEHCVVAPALLVVVGAFGPRRQRARTILRDALPAAALAGAYAAAKVVYVLLWPRPGYRMVIDPAAMVENLGRYVAACFNFLALQTLGPALCTALGVATIGLALWSAGRALTGRSSWRLIALGSSVFLVSLLPVLPLREHQFDHYIGVAAAGAMLALVGALRPLGRHWRPIAIAVFLAVLTTDVRTNARAARRNPIFRLVYGGALASAQWVAAIARTRATAVLLPRNEVTSNVFGIGQAQRYLLPPPQPVVRLYLARDPRVRPDEVLIDREPTILHPGDPMPGWEPRWEFIRRLAPAPREYVLAALADLGIRPSESVWIRPPRPEGS